MLQIVPGIVSIEAYAFLFLLLAFHVTGGFLHVHKKSLQVNKKILKNFKRKFASIDVSLH